MIPASATARSSVFPPQRRQLAVPEPALAGVARAPADAQRLAQPPFADHPRDVAGDPAVGGDRGLDIQGVDEGGDAPERHEGSGTAVVQLHAAGWTTRWEPVGTPGGSSLVGRLWLGTAPD